MIGNLLYLSTVLTIFVLLCIFIGYIIFRISNNLLKPNDIQRARKAFDQLDNISLKPNKYYKNKLNSFIADSDTIYGVNAILKPVVTYKNSGIVHGCIHSGFYHKKFLILLNVQTISGLLW